jgi:hypothetical protein
MNCQKCNEQINEADAMAIGGRTVCEDCYIDLAAKPKACDPWAVYSAKNMSSSESTLTGRQSDIVDYLKKSGPVPPDRLAGDIGLGMDDFEREMATLRHMEIVRAQLQDGRKVIRLW